MASSLCSLEIIFLINLLMVPPFRSWLSPRVVQWGQLIANPLKNGLVSALNGQLQSFSTKTSPPVLFPDESSAVWLLQQSLSFLQAAPGLQRPVSRKILISAGRGWSLKRRRRNKRYSPSVFWELWNIRLKKKKASYWFTLKKQKEINVCFCLPVRNASSRESDWAHADDLHSLL